ncbi:hypothetical protein F4810DRAFT_694769 [Camillea tinctor]|nr:hypothetical protein F4810DRAFT_694769 [Camillea tinctor]
MSSTHVTQYIKTARSPLSQELPPYEQFYRHLQAKMKKGDINIDQSDLEKYQIKCTGIDFVTGDPEDGGLKVLGPMSPNDIADMCDPDMLYTDSDISFPEVSPGIYHTAIDWTNTFLRAFELAPKNGKSTANNPSLPNKTILDLSSWKHAELPDYKYSNTTYVWRSKFTLRPRDDSCLYIICGLANGYAFKDKIPLFGELNTCYWLDKKTSSANKDNNSRSVITLLSFSDRNGRIVQFLRNGSKPPILQISPIIKLGSEEEENRKIFINFMGWAFSTKQGRLPSDCN